jgi:pentatricopeptide repeat protein
MPVQVTMSTIMSALTSNGRWKDAMTLFHGFWNNYNAEPDVVCYKNKVRPSLCAATRMHMTCSFVQVTMSSIMTALTSNGRWEDAMELFHELWNDYNVEPNLVCYNAAVTALAKGRQAGEAEALIVEMQRRGWAPDVYTYAPLIAALGLAGETTAAAQVRLSKRWHTVLIFV